MGTCENGMLMTIFVGLANNANRQIEIRELLAQQRKLLHSILVGSGFFPIRVLRIDLSTPSGHYHHRCI